MLTLKNLKSEMEKESWRTMPKENTSGRLHKSCKRSEQLIKVESNYDSGLKTQSGEWERGVQV